MRRVAVLSLGSPVLVENFQRERQGTEPSAGGIVFFGDMGENFYALDARDARGYGPRNWTAGDYLHCQWFAKGGPRQWGINGIFWPTKVATAKIVILGLGEPPLQ